MPRTHLVATLARLPVDHPRLALLLVAIVAVAALYPPPALHFEQEDVTDLDPDDPEIRRLAEFNRRFGDDEVLVLAIESADAFSTESLRALRRMTDRVLAVQEVERAYSLFLVDDLTSNGGDGGNQRAGGAGGEIVAERFLNAVPDDPAVLATKRARALANDRWTGFLVSKDGTIATLTAVLRKVDGAVPNRTEIARTLRRIGAEETPPGGVVHLVGRGALFLEADEAVKRDMRRYAWLAPLWICGILFYVFRSFRGVVLPLAVCATSVVLALALFVRAGNGLGMLFMLLPIQVAVICLSDVIHILAHHREHVAAEGDSRATLHRTMEYMLPACFFTMITSAIGFLSFNSAGLRSLSVLGTWISIGIAVSFVATMTALPAALSLIGAPKGAVRLTPAISGALVEMSIRLHRLGRRGKRVVAITWVAVLLAAAAGLFRIQVDSDFTSYLPDDSATARASKVLQNKLAGTASLEVMLEGPKYAFEEPWAIAEVERVANALRARPEVDKTFSVLDFLANLRAARGGGIDGKADVPWDGPALTEAFFVLESSKEVDRFVTPDRSAVRISTRLNAHSTKGPVDVVAAVEALRGEIDPRLTLTTTGVSKIFAATSQALVVGQTRSLFTSILLVSLTLFVAVRSVRTGFIALLPNVAPILITLGAMGWIGIKLDIATIMVGSIALGIAVDDTIHLITRHGVERRIEPRNALERTLRTSGHPSIFTTLLFAGGFAVFLLSDFPPMRSFGALAAFAMIVAMFSDLTLLPLLLRDDPVGDSVTAATGKAATE